MFLKMPAFPDYVRVGDNPTAMRILAYTSCIHLMLFDKTAFTEDRGELSSSRRRMAIVFIVALLLVAFIVYVVSLFDRPMAFP